MELEAGKSIIRALAGQAPGGSPLPCLLVADFSLCPHKVDRASSLCLFLSGHQSHHGYPSLMTSSNYLPKFLPPKPSYWRSEVQHVHSWVSLVTQAVKNPPAMQETQVQPLGQEDPLEEEMATHSRMLAWKIPRAEEPGELQSMGLQRVGHDRVTEHKQDLCILGGHRYPVYNTSRVESHRSMWPRGTFYFYLELAGPFVVPHTQSLGVSAKCSK